MTIGLITPYFPDEYTNDSGIANHCLFLADNLAALGHSVVVIHVRPVYKNESDWYTENSPGKNILVITYKVQTPTLISRVFKTKWAVIDFAQKLKCMFVTAKILNKTIKKYKIDVIETSSYFSLCYYCDYIGITVPVAIRVSTTFLQMMKEYYPFKSRGLNIIAKMEISFIKRSRYLITHAVTHARELNLLYNINENLFQIIPHGIKLPDLTNGQAEDASKTRVLFVGRLEYRKGIDILLDAIPMVIADNPDVAFDIIGNNGETGYQGDFLKKNTEPVIQCTTFKGKVNRITLEKAYKNCDIFVAPSRYESFGLIFIEAMSFGKPVIGCDVGGVSQIIKDGKNGLFAETGNAVSLANKIGQLIKDPELRRELGSNARETVEFHFTGKQLAVNSLAYYRKIIAEYKQ